MRPHVPLPRTVRTVVPPSFLSWFAGEKEEEEKERNRSRIQPSAPSAPSAVARAVAPKAPSAPNPPDLAPPALSVGGVAALSPGRLPEALSLR